MPALTISPALPLDALPRSVTVDGAEARFRARPEGDVQRVEVEVPASAGPDRTRRLVFTYDEGTDVYARVTLPDAGSRSEGLRVLRARAEGGALHLVVEGRAGRSYPLGVRTPHRVGPAPGVEVAPSALGAHLVVSFEGNADEYVRRSLALPLR
jgi:hypothetical protein